jgi:predicted RecB family nuclease
LTTSLDGLSEYRAALETASLDGSYTHVTVAASTGYRRRWDDLQVVGGGSPNEETIPTLLLTADGTVGTDDIATRRLGLEAIRHVGPATAERLRNRGVTDRKDVAAMDVPALVELDGVHRADAEGVLDHVRAMVEETVVVRDHEEFPDRSVEPVFVDIETDGLTPTAVWLVGVLDRTEGTGSRKSLRERDATDGRFVPFLQKEPDASGYAVESFVSWYLDNASHRPLIAYNGWGFDFDVLERFVERHCPERLDDWTDTNRFDPLKWAVSDGHAALPGRTNRLADVATALGWETGATGLSGEVVARKYRRWCRSPSKETELDWDRHVRYCEDDVRALARVYDELADVDPVRRTRASSSAGDETTQGTLEDF